MIYTPIEVRRRRWYKRYWNATFGRELLYIRWATRMLAWRRAIFRHCPPHYCSICLRQDYCRRLSANELIQDSILRGEMCPDVETVWKKVFE